MIIWINGPFGVGKTQTAYELNYRIPNSIVVDPEEVGFFLQKQILPESRLPDFQDYSLWRKWVSELLHEAQNDRKRVIIVPMTVVSETYFRQIINPLDDAGIVVQDFTLIARKETIERRLKRRFDGGSWNFRQIDRCLSGLESDVFSKKIDTDRLDLYQVVDCILNELGPEIDSIRKKSGRAARFIRRLRVFLSHIRIV
jgi:hypothetical protein